MFKNIKVENNRAGARGHSARNQSRQLDDRLHRPVARAAEGAHEEPGQVRPGHLRAPKDDPEVGGDYYGLPWPCWGTPEIRHPGTPILYNTTVAARTAAAASVPALVSSARRWPTEVSLLAEGSYSVGSEIKDGYPEFTLGVLKKLGWDKDLTAEELATIEKVAGANTRCGVLVDRPLRRHPARRDQARLRRPTATPRRACSPGTSPTRAGASRADLHAARRPGGEIPDLPDAKQFRLPNIGFSVQKAAVDKGIAKQFPLILTSGRLVEYEGGGEETRSNKWLAELQQDMFVEINPSDATERGIKDGGWVWVTGAENGSKAKMKALVTERVGKGVAWMPFHFGGWYRGQGSAQQISAGRRSLSCSAKAPTRSRPTATIRRPACRSPRPPCARSERLKEATTMARMKFLCDADRCIECNACVTACKNENEVPWGINRRRVVTLNDGKPGERSVSMACMHCTDAPCAAVCPVNCFYTTADAVVLHSKDLCIGCGYCFYACPFGAPQYPKVGNFGSRGKMDKCTFCAGGPEADGSKEEYEKYGANRLAEGKLPLCAEMCSTKSLLAGDGDVIAQIYKERVAKRGYGSGAWGWQTAYRETIAT